MEDCNIFADSDPPRSTPIEALMFFGEPIPCRNEVTYPGVKFLAPSWIGVPWSLKLYLKDLSNQIRQNPPILRHLGCPNSALCAMANIQPVFHLHLAAGYREIGRLLALIHSPNASGRG